MKGVFHSFSVVQYQCYQLQICHINNIQARIVNLNAVYVWYDNIIDT